MFIQLIDHQTQLDRALDYFSLESVEDDKKPHGALPRLVAYLHEVGRAVSSRFSTYADVPFVAHDFKHTILKLENIPWVSLREQSFSCIPGLKKDYLSYIDAMHSAAEHVSKLDTGVLSPIIRMLAEHVTHPGRLASYAPDDAVAELVKSIPLKETSHATHHMLSMVETHPTFNRKPYGKLIKRNADWAEVAAKMEAVRQIMQTLDRKAIAVKVDRLNQIFADIISMLKEGNEVTKVTRHIAMELAKAAHAAAQMVEFYSMIQHRALIAQEYLAKFSEEINALR